MTARGFVIEWADRRNVKPGGCHRTYWYGPDHGLGTTWGPLGSQSAVFASRPAAVKAWETVRPWAAKMDGVTIVRVIDVEDA